MGVTDHRRHHRHDIDATGWVPWRGLQVLGFFAFLAFTVVAMKTG